MNLGFAVSWICPLSKRSRVHIQLHSLIIAKETFYGTVVSIRRQYMVASNVKISGLSCCSFLAQMWTDLKVLSLKTNTKRLISDKKWIRTFINCKIVQILVNTFNQKDFFRKPDICLQSSWTFNWGNLDLKKRIFLIAMQNLNFNETHFSDCKLGCCWKVSAVKD